MVSNDDEKPKGQAEEAWQQKPSSSQAAAAQPQPPNDGANRRSTSIDDQGEDLDLLREIVASKSSKVEAKWKAYEGGKSTTTKKPAPAKAPAAKKSESISSDRKTEDDNSLLQKSSSEREQLDLVREIVQSRNALDEEAEMKANPDVAHGLKAVATPYMALSHVGSVPVPVGGRTVVASAQTRTTSVVENLDLDILESTLTSKSEGTGEKQTAKASLSFWGSAQTRASAAEDLDLDILESILTSKLEGAGEKETAKASAQTRRASGATEDLDFDILESILTSKTEGAGEKQTATISRPIPPEVQPGAYSGAPGVSMRRVTELPFALVGVNPELSTVTYTSTNGIEAQPELATTTRTERSNDSNHGLAVANMVYESSRRVVGQAKEVDITTGDTTSQKRTRQLILWGIGLGVLVGVIVAVVLVVTIMQTEDAPANSTDTLMPSNDFTNAPTVSMEDYLLSLFPQDTVEAIHTSDSSQQEAFQWLLEDMEANQMSEERILQRFALATFYHATEGPQWDHSDHWLDHTVHECHWNSTDYFDGYEDDITYLNVENKNPCEQEVELNMTDDSGIIQHIWLRNNSLGGTLPPDFFWLTSIRSINLDDDSVTGTFPLEFIQLTSLEVLSMMWNSFTGTIPPGIWRENLTTVTIADNQLSGTIPTEIGLATDLIHLYLYDNGDITGTIPTELALLADLDGLLLDGMQLTGTIPTELGLMSAMAYFKLYNNMLTGNIPTQMGQLTHTREFELDVNYLHGPIPSELGWLRDMEILTLFDNQLIGHISTQLGLLSKLVQLELDENNLSGQIPSEVGQLNAFMILTLFDNGLAGLIPTQLGMLENIRNLQLHNNTLSGSIPHELAGLGGLEVLFLQNNDLIGVMPEKLCHVDSIEFDCSELLCGCGCHCNVSYGNSTQ